MTSLPLKKYSHSKLLWKLSKSKEIKNKDEGVQTFEGLRSKSQEKDYWMELQAPLIRDCIAQYKCELLKIVTNSSGLHACLFDDSYYEQMLLFSTYLMQCIKPTCHYLGFCRTYNGFWILYMEDFVPIFYMSYYVILMFPMIYSQWLTPMFPNIHSLLHFRFVHEHSDVPFYILFQVDSLILGPSKVPKLHVWCFKACSFSECLR